MRTRGILAPRNPRVPFRAGNYAPGPNYEAHQRAQAAQEPRNAPGGPMDGSNDHEPQRAPQAAQQAESGPTPPPAPVRGPETPPWRLHGGRYAGGTVEAPEGHPLREQDCPACPRPRTRTWLHEPGCAAAWHSQRFGAGRGTLIFRRGFERGTVVLKLSGVTGRGPVMVQMKPSYHHNAADAIEQEQAEARRLLAVAMSEARFRCARPDAPVLAAPFWANEQVSRKMTAAVKALKDHGVNLPAVVGGGTGIVDESMGVVEEEFKADVAAKMAGDLLPLARRAHAEADREDVDARITAALAPVKEALEACRKALAAIAGEGTAYAPPADSPDREGYA